MLEHTKHGYYTDMVYCPQTHEYETFTIYRGDTDPGMESCDGCRELFEVSTLAVAA